MKPSLSVLSLLLFFAGSLSTNTVQAIYFARARCYARFLAIGYSLLNYDRYNVYYRDDSKFVFALVGEFVGPEDIEEYIRLLDPSSTPFYTDVRLLGPAIQFEGYNEETGQCVFLAFSTLRFVSDPANTRLATTTDVAFLSKISFDFEERYISRIDGYLTKEAAANNWGYLLDSDDSRDWVCSVITSDACESIIGVQENCSERLAALPTTEGESNHMDGNSQSCRTNHAVFANLRPELHCAHISLDPFPDPQGRIKCQESLGWQFSDFLTEEELASFRQYAERRGIDPELGFMTVE
mmetsp:Transcript_10283/g.15739  ORF Transcript_10283/g.15739 Transcript_10283/m.15739 type:complete len:296 (+) Transcript_10283:44-931(+)|eukprot:CAMPEP_0118688312 /NCGR_PEP_ID=MMETSP0800-20121206/8852_1 /TAXON_ID=210618 ORGANISM="Striatella unipunctata, Strain CCMP2910" /NCGR_SAMPLE_ID=MMETSP0800 /ASSEMBLY_ACC=CAM_ASM_000638 /LENGTH=295 /DNA_ID=CAMNT_0006585561 /DNA_START=34 /DNA_END=921 /DNA_ORIENTATION=+